MIPRTSPKETERPSSATFSPLSNRGKSFLVDLDFVGFGLVEFPVSHGFTLAAQHEKGKRLGYEGKASRM